MTIRSMSPTRALSSYALSTLLLANPALAATFNVSSTEPHGHWQSMALSLGDERHFRAVETHSYSDATLSVNTTQGVCDLPWLEMRVTLAQQQGESRAVNLVPTRFAALTHFRALKGMPALTKSTTGVCGWSVGEYKDWSRAETRPSLRGVASTCFLLRLEPAIVYRCCVGVRRAARAEAVLLCH